MSNIAEFYFYFFKYFYDNNPKLYYTDFKQAFEKSVNMNKIIRKISTDRRIFQKKALKPAENKEILLSAGHCYHSVRMSEISAL
jgi:hypothetical protein